MTSLTAHVRDQYHRVHAEKVPSFTRLVSEARPEKQRASSGLAYWRLRELLLGASHPAVRR
jgi:hypothetical protein